MKKIVFLCVLGIVSLMSEEIYATFDVEAQYKANLTAKSGGEIKEILVVVGEKVTKGQTLVKLDNIKQKLALELAKNSVAIGELSYKNSKRTFSRYAKLKKVIDKERYDRFEFDRDLKKESLETAKINLALAKERYEDTFIKAPFSGQISKQYVDMGNSVGTKNPILEIVDSSLVKLVLTFDEKYWKKVKAGQKFFYKLDGDKSQREGVITKVYPTVNPKNRKIKAEVLEKNLIPGLFGDGVIVVK